MLTGNLKSVPSSCSILGSHQTLQYTVDFQKCLPAKQAQDTQYHTHDNAHNHFCQKFSKISSHIQARSSRLSVFFPALFISYSSPPEGSPASRTKMRPRLSVLLHLRRKCLFSDVLRTRRRQGSEDGRERPCSEHRRSPLAPGGGKPPKMQMVSAKTGVAKGEGQAHDLSHCKPSHQRPGNRTGALTSGEVEPI